MAARVTAFINTKGGVGKTTLTLEVATAMAAAGNRVLVIDADPETGATKWQTDREDKPLFSIVGMATSKLHREIPAHAANLDYILIDAPPQNDSISKSALMAAECALIPVTPSMHDLRRTEAFLTTVEDAQIANPLLKVAFVLNHRIVNTAIGRDVLGFLGNFPFPILKTVVHSRVVFAEASAGRSVLEIAPTSLAAHEILSLTHELLEMLNHAKANRSSQKAASQS